MKLKLTPVNAGIIMALLVLIVVMTFLAFRPASEVEELPSNLYFCGEQYTVFRANVSDGLAVPVSPSESELVNLLMNPTVSAVYILLDPEAKVTEGFLAAYDIDKILDKGFYIPTFVAYTKPSDKDPNTPVMSITNATFDTPILWLKNNQNRTSIEIDGPRVIVYAQDSYGLDAAACKIAILAINDKLDCE